MVLSAFRKALNWFCALFIASTFWFKEHNPSSPHMMAIEPRGWDQHKPKCWVCSPAWHFPTDTLGKVQCLQKSM